MMRIARRLVAALSKGVEVALIGLVRLYQWTLGPILGGRCRFEPSCSRYAIAALRKHGPWRGTAKTIGRLLRCHPWHPGGFDPP
jgi:putative membrane protein insertion efficiency factor